MDAAPGAEDPEEARRRASRRDVGRGAEQLSGGHQRDLAASRGNISLGLGRRREMARSGEAAPMAVTAGSAVSLMPGGDLSGGRFLHTDSTGMSV